MKPRANKVEYISEEGSKAPGASVAQSPCGICLELEGTTGRIDHCSKVLTDSAVVLVNFAVLSKDV
jgi:hypothetical protein